MLQDIQPSVYNNHFAPIEPTLADRALLYKGDAVLVLDDPTDPLRYPTFEELGLLDIDDRTQAQYLFSIDDVHYFLPSLDPLFNQRLMDCLEGNDQANKLNSDRFQDFSDEDVAACESQAVRYIASNMIHATEHGAKAFAGLIGLQLWQWYDTSRYCGKCGHKTAHSDKERMVFCPQCGQMIYPRINPAVIVGIVHYGENGAEDKVLVARGIGRPVNARSLVAGFAETGETIEQTVKREVLEEVGLHVKNLRFYKTQPWPLSSSLLFGFFCEVDGDAEIHVQEEELDWADWIPRNELLEDDTNYSLTREMMGVMRAGKEREYPVTSL